MATRVKMKPLRLKKNLGAVIKAKRGKKNQEDCAKKAGMTQAHWSQIERGAIKTENISIKVADRIAFGLGTDLNFFLSKK